MCIKCESANVKTVLSEDHELNTLIVENRSQKPAGHDVTSCFRSGTKCSEILYKSTLNACGRPISKRDFSTPRPGLWGTMRDAEVRVGPVIGSSTLTHMVYLLPLLSYLAGSKSVSTCPSDPDTMTNTALEAIVSSNSYDSLA